MKKIGFVPLTIMGNRQIVAGSEANSIVLLDATGHVLKKAAVSGPLLKIEPINESEFRVLTAEGQISVFRLVSS